MQNDAFITKAIKNILTIVCDTVCQEKKIIIIRIPCTLAGKTFRIFEIEKNVNLACATNNPQCKFLDRFWLLDRIWDIYEQ